LGLLKNNVSFTAKESQKSLVKVERTEEFNKQFQDDVVRVIFRKLSLQEEKLMYPLNEALFTSLRWRQIRADHS
jgi:hypothetical protein